MVFRLIALVNRICVKEKKGRITFCHVQLQHSLSCFFLSEVTVRLRTEFPSNATVLHVPFLLGGVVGASGTEKDEGKLEM